MNLELIETDQLLDELMRRFEHAVFHGLKVNEALESHYECRRQCGNSRTCQGLAFGIMTRCEEDLRSRSEPTIGDT